MDSGANDSAAPHPPPPYAVDVHLIREMVPAALREGVQWVGWRYIERDGRPTKCPISATKGGEASSIDPATWGTFEEALTACDRGGLDGVGFVFSPRDPFTGVDLDDCIDAAGQIKPWAQEIIGKLNSYSEISPSGRGLKIFVKATKPGPRCKTGYQDGAVEIYDRARYFTVTGQHLPATPRSVESRQTALSALYEQLFGQPPAQGATPSAESVQPNPQAPPDDDIIRILEKSKAGENFKRLWEGRWNNGDGRYPSQNEADLALIGYLTFMCGADPERIDRLFRRSGLYREKWERADYRRRTIAKALDGKTSFYRPGEDFEVGWEPAWPTEDRHPREGNGNVAPNARSPEPTLDPNAARHAARLPIERAKAGHPYPTTDLGNAERFAARFGDEVRFVAGLGWLAWDGCRWREDDTRAVMRLAGRCVREILRESAACATAGANASDEATKAKHATAAKELLGWARRSESRERLNAMIDLARALPPLAIRIGELDADLWALNCLNGTLDLRTGVLRAHDRRNLITKLAPVAYDPHAPCPHWLAFLDRIFDGIAALIQFVQRSMGYALTGVVYEHIVHILFGNGANGKSTFLETMAAMLGDYATAAAPRLLIRRKNEAHPTELADLRGARFVSSIETAEGGAFDEERVKALSGGDRIKARKMCKDFFEFQPTFKLFLATNHRPIIRGDDNGIWRRIRLWPFTVEIPLEEQDPTLKDILRAELAGILAWCVRGCIAWQEQGLGEPSEVLVATQSYREEQDYFGSWFNECCLTPGEGEDPTSYKCSGSPIYQSYALCCDRNGVKPLGNWKFTERLLKRPGIVRSRERVTTYLGVRLTDEAHIEVQSTGQSRWGGRHAEG